MTTKVQEPLRFGRRYPWDIWFSKTQFTLRLGVHYTCRTYAMAQQVRIAAGPNRHNVQTRISISEDQQSITVDVLGKRTP